MTVTTAGDSGFSIGRVVSRTFGVIGRNLVPFLILTALATLPQEFMLYFLSQTTAAAKTNPAVFATGSFWLATLASILIPMVLAFVLQAALVYGTIMDLNEQHVSFREALMTSLKVFFPLVGLALLTGLGVGLAFMLLIVPGLMLMTAWAVSVPVLVVERKGIFDSFSRSGELTRGHRWAIFGIIIVFFIGVVIVQMASRPLFGLTMANSIPAGFPLSYLIFDGIVKIITAVVGATGVACIYYELRSAKEGIGPQQLASVFE